VHKISKGLWENNTNLQISSLSVCFGLGISSCKWKYFCSATNLHNFLKKSYLCHSYPLKNLPTNWLDLLTNLKMNIRYLPSSSYLPLVFIASFHVSTQLTSMLIWVSQYYSSILLLLLHFSASSCCVMLQVLHSKLLSSPFKFGIFCIFNHNIPQVSWIIVFLIFLAFW